MAETILIVEDEEDLASLLEFNFRQAGFETLRTASGQQALRLARSDPSPDLVVLDLNLPDLQGTEVCRALRNEPRTREIGIIMLTARSDEIDRVVGFEVGADDYVVKPFSTRELVLRVRSLLRRRNPPTLREQSAFGELRIDHDGHRVWVTDKEVPLTALEFRLLTTLCARRGRVQNRDQLLQDVWGKDGNLTTRTVDTHVKRLREKLGSAARWVETVRGVGYRFRDESDSAP